MSLIITSDTEEFTPSECTCEKCIQMKLSQDEWDSFKPKTKLQKRMKNAVSSIEKRIKKKRNSKSRSSIIPEQSQ